MRYKAYPPVFLLLFFFFFLSGLQECLFSTENTRLIIPESYPARKQMQNLMLGIGSPGAGKESLIFNQQETGNSVCFRVVEDKDSCHYLFLTATPRGKYPLLRRGNISIKKDKQGGNFLYMTIMLRDSADSYLRVFPDGERAKMDIVLAGYPLYLGVNLSVPFSRLLSTPFSGIQLLTGELVDWDLLLFGQQRAGDRKLAVMSTEIRKMLPYLRDADDGAFDERGNPVFIRSLNSQGTRGGLNCSGFAKWVVDNYYYSLRKKWLPVAELKNRYPALRGNSLSHRFEEARDPYFGLDWTRNLAVFLAEAERGYSIEDYESFDVCRVPFFEYIEDIGYPVENLKLLLYVLTVNQPGSFYLASVNGKYGRNPVLHQHFHVVVLVPYFTEDGIFRVSVFERNRETGLDSLVKRYSRDFLHLVAVRTDLEFAAESLFRLQTDGAKPSG